MGKIQNTLLRVKWHREVGEKEKTSDMRRETGPETGVDQDMLEIMQERVMRTIEEEAKRRVGNRKQKEIRQRGCHSSESRKETDESSCHV